MKRFIITCGIGLVGCLSGLWLGWRPAPSSAIHEPNKLSAFSATHRTQGKNVLSPEAPHDFKALTHRQAQLNGLSQECLDALKHQNASQLKELLLNLCEPDIRPGTYEAQRALWQLRLAAAKELYLLEKNTAMSWAMSLDNTDALLMVWAAAAQEDPSMIKKWKSDYDKSKHTSSLDAVFSKAYSGVASRGSAALIAFEDEFDYGSKAWLSEIPDDFDFHAYFNRPKPKDKELIQAWTARDPGAVAAYLKERQSSPSSDYHQMILPALEAKRLISSEHEAARWVLPLLDTPENQIRLYVISPSMANALLDAMPDDNARINYLSRNLFSSMARNSDLKAAERILQRLGSNQQADAYSRWIDSWQSSLYPQPSGTPLLEEYLKVSRIPEDERTRLIEKARQTGK